MSRIVIASNNPGKLREFSALFAPLGFDAVAQSALGIDEPEEPHVTFVENALAKARHASAASKLPSLADDSGLCVDALGGLPGVRSARYAETSSIVDRETQDRRNNDKLVEAMAKQIDRDAYYICCLVFIRHADDPEPIIATGRWAGQIVAAPRGAQGFGYDPHFLVTARGQTVAELDLATKNRISHRALAMNRLVDELEARGFAGASAT